MPFTRTTARRTRTRASNQLPTLRRENAEVIYETVTDQGYDVDLSSGVDHLLAFFDQTYDGRRHSVNTAANRARQVAPAMQSVGRRVEEVPQLPVYTKNPSSEEMTVDSTPSESLPAYSEEGTHKEGKKQSDLGEVPPRSQ